MHKSPLTSNVQIQSVSFPDYTTLPSSSLKLKQQQSVIETLCLPVVGHFLHHCLCV